MNLKLNKIIEQLEGKVDCWFLNKKFNERLILKNQNFLDQIIFQKDLTMSLIHKTSFSNITFRQTSLVGTDFCKCNFRNCIF